MQQIANSQSAYMRGETVQVLIYLLFSQIGKQPKSTATWNYANLFGTSEFKTNLLFTIKASTKLMLVMGFIILH